MPATKTMCPQPVPHPYPLLAPQKLMVPSILRPTEGKMYPRGAK